MKAILAALIGAAFIAIVAANFGSASHGASPAVTVAVHGVRVIKPPPGGDDTLRAFHDDAGTKVALLVTEPDGGLVLFNGDDSRVKSFVDDLGKDLTKREPGTKVEIEVPESWVFGPQATVSQNRKYCSLEVNMPGFPSKEATTLTLSGTLVFKIAKEKTDFTAENVALQAGTEVKAGDIRLTIKRAGKPRFGSKNALEIEFDGKQSLDAIARIRFFDADGKKIEAEEAGRSSGKSLNGGSASWFDATIDYQLKNTADTAKIVITCWKDMKEVTVPFDLKVSLGL